jgi:hypothetical protein
LGIEKLNDESAAPITKQTIHGKPSVSGQFCMENISWRGIFNRDSRQDCKEIFIF